MSINLPRSRGDICGEDSAQALGVKNGGRRSFARSGRCLRSVAFTGRPRGPWPTRREYPRPLVQAFSEQGGPLFRDAAFLLQRERPEKIDRIKALGAFDLDVGLDRSLDGGAHGGNRAESGRRGHASPAHAAQHDRGRRVCPALLRANHALLDLESRTMPAASRSPPARRSPALFFPTSGPSSPGTWPRPSWSRSCRRLRSSTTEFRAKPVEQVVWFTLRGLGVRDEAIKRYYNPEALTVLMA